jgi:hypothetical protein
MATAAVLTHAGCAAAAAAAGLQLRLSPHVRGWRRTTTGRPRSHPTSGEAAAASGGRTRLVAGRRFVCVMHHAATVAPAIAPALLCGWWLCACPVAD